MLRPALEKLLPNYPDIKVEIVIDYGLTDIVAGQVDAGVRFGEQIAKDMIAAGSRLSSNKFSPTHRSFHTGFGPSGVVRD